MKITIFLLLLSNSLFSVSFEQNSVTKDVHHHYIALFSDAADTKFEEHQTQVLLYQNPLIRQREIADRIEELAEKFPEQKEEFLVHGIHILKYWAPAKK